MELFTNNIVLIMVMILILIIVAILIKGRGFQNWTSCLYLMTGGYICFEFYLLQTGNFIYYPHILMAGVPVVFLLIPFWFFVVQGLLYNKSSLTVYDLLHFVPFFLSVLFLIPYYLLDAEQKIFIYKVVISGDFHIYSIPYIGCQAYLIVYEMVTFGMVYRALSRKNHETKDLQLLLGKIILICLAYALHIIAILTGLNQVLFYLQAASAVAAVSLVYIFLIRYLYLDGRALTTGQNKNRQASRSYLTGVDVEAVIKKLDALFNQEKIFCDEDLSLNRLSSLLGITAHQLSELLNDTYKCNFNSFINKFRIREAKKMLLSDDERQTLSIAYSVGFNSYSPFFSAFKKETGASPEQYRKMLKN